MNLLEKAIEVAVRAHAGQVDKAGSPYILHPLRVMMSVTGEVAQIAAVLHDVVEDTVVTLENLRGYGFPERVVEAVEALTKRPGETRMEAAKRIALNPIAIQVKLADLADNMDLSRLSTPTASDHARLAEYMAVREYLLSVGSAC